MPEHRGALKKLYRFFGALGKGILADHVFQSRYGILLDGRIQRQGSDPLALSVERVLVQSLFLEDLAQVLVFHLVVGREAAFDAGVGRVQLVERVVVAGKDNAQSVVGQHRIALERFFEQLTGFEIVVYAQRLECLVEPSGRKRKGAYHPSRKDPYRFSDR